MAFAPIRENDEMTSQQGARDAKLRRAAVQMRRAFTDHRRSLYR